jgi:hypothetical protein
MWPERTTLPVRGRRVHSEVSVPIHFARGLGGLLIGGLCMRKVIHSNLQRSPRFTGSSGVSAAGGLWMNLWKLWIARHC